MYEFRIPYLRLLYCRILSDWLSRAWYCSSDWYVLCVLLMLIANSITFSFVMMAWWNRPSKYIPNLLLIFLPLCILPFVFMQCVCMFVTLFDPLCINAFVAQDFMFRLLSVSCTKITFDINHSIDQTIFTCEFVAFIVWYHDGFFRWITCIVVHNAWQSFLYAYDCRWISAW